MEELFKTEFEILYQPGLCAALVEDFMPCFERHKEDPAAVLDRQGSNCALGIEQPAFGLSVAPRRCSCTREPLARLTPPPSAQPSPPPSNRRHPRAHRHHPPRR